AGVAVVELARAQQRRASVVLLEETAEETSDCLRAILCTPAAIPDLLREHLGAAIDVEFLDLVDRQSPSQERRDDRASAGPGEEVKNVPQHELRPVERFTKFVFDGAQHLKGEHAADAAAIKGEDAFHRNEVAKEGRPGGKNSRPSALGRE